MSAELLFKLVIRFAQIYLAWWQSHQDEPTVAPTEVQPLLDEVVAILTRHEQRLAALEALHHSELAPDAPVTLAGPIME